MWRILAPFSFVVVRGGPVQDLSLLLEDLQQRSEDEVTKHTAWVGESTAWCEKAGSSNEMEVEGLKGEITKKENEKKEECAAKAPLEEAHTKAVADKEAAMKARAKFEQEQKDNAQKYGDMYRDYKKKLDDLKKQAGGSSAEKEEAGTEKQGENLPAEEKPAEGDVLLLQKDKEPEMPEKPDTDVPELPEAPKMPEMPGTKEPAQEAEAPAQEEEAPAREEEVVGEEQAAEPEPEPPAKPGSPEEEIQKIEEAIAVLLQEQASVTQELREKIAAAVQTTDGLRDIEEEAAVALGAQVEECKSVTRQLEFLFVTEVNARKFGAGAKTFCESVQAHEVKYAEGATAAQGGVTACHEAVKAKGGAKTLLQSVRGFVAAQKGGRFKHVHANKHGGVVANFLQTKHPMDSIITMIKDMITKLEAKNNKDMTHAEFCAEQLPVLRSRIREKKKVRKEKRIEMKNNKKAAKFLREETVLVQDGLDKVEEETVGMKSIVEGGGRRRQEIVQGSKTIAGIVEQANSLLTEFADESLSASCADLSAHFTALSASHVETDQTVSEAGSVLLKTGEEILTIQEQTAADLESEEGNMLESSADTKFEVRGLHDIIMGLEEQLKDMKEECVGAATGDSPEKSRLDRLNDEIEALKNALEMLEA